MEQGLSTIGKDFLDGIKRSAGTAIVVGVILAIVGFLAFGSPLVTGLSMAIVVGAMLLIGGVAHLALSFSAGSFGRGLLSAISGVLTAVVGLLMVSRPGVGLASLTLFLAAYFMVTGIFEILWAFQIKPVKGWGWTLFSGAVSVLLGLMIWSEFPLSGAWAIGTLVGIKLFLSGWMLIMLGFGARGVVKAATA